MANLGSGNDNINIDGATSSFVDFGGADTYTILSSLSGDVTITDNQASTINLPAGLTISNALFLSDGVQFTIGGNTVTLIGNPALYTFVFGGTPLDTTAGTPLSFEDTAVAFGTTVPAPGEAPNAATTTGDVNDDGTVGASGTPEEIYAEAIAAANDALADAAAAQQAADDAEALVTDLASAEAYEAAAEAAKAAADAAKAAADAAAAAAANTADGADDVEAAQAVADAEAAQATADAEVTNAEAAVEFYQPPTFELTGPATTGEAATATFTVTASKPVTEETEVTFQLVAGDESAPDQGGSDTNLNDFTQGSFTEATVTIPVGGTTATFSVTPRSDGLTELTEVFSVDASVGATVLTPVTTSVIDGGGETFILTTNVDNVTDPVDIVRGLMNDDGTDDLDTFSSGDFIQGTGTTEVRISLVDGNTADFVEMEGVNALTFRGAGETAQVDFDASSYGDDLNIFTLSGADGADADVDNVTFDDGPLIFDIAPGTTGTLDVTGEAGPFTTFSVDLSTTGDDGASLISDIGNAGIQVFAGENADVELDADIDLSDTNADVMIDPLDIGDVSLVAETSATADVSISMSADANTTGDASIGDVTIGMVNLTGGSSADVTFSSYRFAYADEGNATIGNLTVGDVALNGTDTSADLYVYMSASASVSTGDATVGDTTIGNIDIALADDADEATFSIENYAEVDTGTATVGNMLVGDISADIGVSADADVDLYQSAEADTSGDAIVGSITVGDVNVTLGESASFSLSLSQTADADSGNAMVGALTIGNVMADMGDDSDLNVYATNEASVDAGFTATVGDVTVGDVMLTQASGAHADITLEASADATGDGNGIVGNVMLGNVTSVMGLDASLHINVDVSASGTGTMTAIGNVSVGDVTLSSDAAGLQASASLQLDVDSDGSVGDVTVGAVMVDFLDDSTFDYDVNITAGTANDGALGAVSLGDVDVVADSNNYFVGIFGDMTAGVDIGNVMLAGDDIEWNNITLSASADIGDVTIGDIMLDAATNLSVSTGININATGDIGSVTIGDVSIDYVNSDSFTIDIFASDDLGDVSVGDISVTASATAAMASDIYGQVYVQVSGSQDVGNVTVGDVTILNSGGGSNYGSNYVSLDVDAGTGDDLGNVTIGDIELTSVALGFDTGGTGVFGSFTANIGSNADSVGDVVVGDISLHATAGNTVAIADADNDEANPRVSINADQGSTIASLMVGNIDVLLTNSVDSSTGFTGLDYNGASADVSVSSDAAITVGDITISAVNDSTVDVQGGVGAGLFDVNISLSADAGADDITIGDITVSGGDVDTASVVLDNLGNITGWLTLTGATVTVGDVDYSGYAADATIDVSGFAGAENIMAASGDTDITVNDTQNIVTLGAGDDEVFYTAEEQSGTTQADIDQIIDFTSGTDLINFTAFALGGSAGIGGTVADYDTFLTTAQAAMTFDDFDVFTMTDGTNTYVAVNSDNDANEIIDFVIELTGVTAVTTGDLVM